MMNREVRLGFLRYQGIGYKKIGVLLDLSRDIKRGYCKRDGLNGLATDLVKIKMKNSNER